MTNSFSSNPLLAAWFLEQMDGLLVGGIFGGGCRLVVPWRYTVSEHEVPQYLSKKMQGMDRKKDLFLFQKVHFSLLVSCWVFCVSYSASNSKETALEHFHLDMMRN